MNLARFNSSNKNICSILFKSRIEHSSSSSIQFNDHAVHHKKEIFCFVESVEDHWILEKNFSTDQIFEAFKANLKESKSDLMITRWKWHEMLKHLESKTISYLKNEMNEIKRNDLESISLINWCETCVFIKKHHLISRQIDRKKSIDHSLSEVEYDLISMIEN